ncbi:MAG: stage II sporulation protein D [Firmicutes bacterium]|nr:stage II sporulation protein D [Bacillota bacterium]MBV1727500.1 stage II sporulation protein D [Desulforudis sp.]MDZ7609916.1 stage II sporulation protein D [Eubacteriales bacterium]MBU4534196.1 stage II sporulation protein D [Bacillota bacterium]MBU4553842.1 stage II sporulation protein D [Bacillota bacterium]
MKRLIIGLFLVAVALTLAFPDLARERYEQYVDIERPKPPSVVRMYVHDSDQIVNLSLEDYIVGVVAAEMPAEFHPEALKAQALCARTYMLKRLGAGGVANTIHPGADACDDPRHGQGWLSREQLRERWGTLDYYRYYYRIKKAVADTEGLVITHGGELIDPVYHSSCGGSTQHSEDVWQVALPYLRGVTCPHDHDPYPGDRKRFTLEQVDQALGTGLAAVAVSAGGNAKPIEVLEYTSTGRPKTLSVAGKTLPSTTIREKLGLRSTDFSAVIEDGHLELVTYGHGHGVGLCQWGANGLAKHGYDSEGIIGHYYMNVKVEPY